MKATTLQQALAQSGSVLALESGLMLPSLVSVSQCVCVCVCASGCACMYVYMCVCVPV